MYISHAISNQGRKTGVASVGPRQTAGRQATLYAPTKGLNSKDNILNMGKEYGVELTNFFPTSGSVELRRGYTEYAAASTGIISTLFNHINGGLEKLYAFSGTDIYDVTDGDSDTSLYTIVSDKFHVVNFNGFGIGVSGEDVPIKISDSDIEELAITGITTSANLNYVLPFKNRLYFVEKDSAKFLVSAC